MVLSELDAQGLRQIIAELVEVASRVNVAWTLALSAESRGDLDRAMTHLATIKAQLGKVPIQIDDIRHAAEVGLMKFEESTQAK